MSERDELQHALRQANAELDVSHPNWTAILARARWRLALRLGVALALAAAGSLLLLGGGLKVHAVIVHQRTGRKAPNLAVAKIRPTSAVIENSGTREAGPFEVVVETIPFGGKPRKPQRFHRRGLPAGGSWRLTFACGSGRVTVRIASSESRGESELGDNERSRRVRCRAKPRRRPNLAVGRIDATDVVIENRGNRRAGPFEVVVETVPFGGKPRKPQRFHRSGLPVGGSLRLTFACGSGRVTVRIASSESRGESELGDNERSRRVRCRAKPRRRPNLAVGRIDATDVVIENRGNGRAGPFEVVVETVPDEGESPEPQSFPHSGLPAGRRWRVPFDCASGPTTVAVRIVPMDRRGESKLDDNKGAQKVECEPAAGAPNLAVLSLSEKDVVIENKGNETAEPFAVLITIKPIEGEESTETLHATEPLEPGERKSFDITCNAGDLVTVEVNPEDQVEESEKGDNSERLECTGDEEEKHSLEGAARLSVRTKR